MWRRRWTGAELMTAFSSSSNRMVAWMASRISYVVGGFTTQILPTTIPNGSPLSGKRAVNEFQILDESVIGGTAALLVFGAQKRRRMHGNDQRARRRMLENFSAQARNRHGAP